MSRAVKRGLAAAHETPAAPRKRRKTAIKTEKRIDLDEQWIPIE